MSNLEKFWKRIKIAKNPFNRLIFASKAILRFLETILFFRKFLSQKFEQVKFGKIFLKKIEIAQNPLNRFIFA